MTDTSKLGFGLKRADIPAAPAMWGARAIYTGHEVDLLPDRQHLVFDDEDARKALLASINKQRRGKTPIAKFREWARDRFAHDSEAVESVTFDGVTFYASTNASHGYLYVTAFRTEDT